MSTYAYVRISRPSQNPERQIRNIVGYDKSAKVYQEAYTGTTMNREQWNRLCKVVKRGDKIIFDSVSRMSRTADEGTEEYFKLYDSGVELIFLKEPHINTETYSKAMQNTVPMTGSAVDCILQGVNSYIKELAREQIRLAFIQSEKEVMDLRQRTSEGIKTARINGKVIGRPKGIEITTKKSIVAKEIIRKHSKTLGGTLSDTDCIKLAGISRNTYFKYKREIMCE